MITPPLYPVASVFAIKVDAPTFGLISSVKDSPAAGPPVIDGLVLE